MFILRMIIILILIFSLQMMPIDAKNNSKDSLIFIIRSSPDSEFVSRLHLTGSPLIKDILQAPMSRGERLPELQSGLLVIKHNNKTSRYIISYYSNLFSEDGHQILVSAGVQKSIDSYLRVLSKHHYGEPLPWDDVKTIFPMKGYCEVTDIESGLRFRVQRRAGSHHADVQPVAVEDTDIMKKIYGGKWSWKRRAILVHISGQIIAASMHGMPHGSGAIHGNNFPGHFCIHFKESTTHRRDYPDPGHDLMISKAAGQLYERIHLGSPEELASLFVSAINEQDSHVVHLLMNSFDESTHSELVKYLEEEIEMIRLVQAENRMEYKDIDPFGVEIPIQVRIKKRAGKEQFLSLRLVFSRNSYLQRWQLEPQPIIEQLVKKRGIDDDGSRRGI